MAVIRPGLESDLAQIDAIYDHYVRTTPITFDIEPWTPERRLEWFGHYAESGRYRLLVADEDGLVAGYATSSPLNDRDAYVTSITTSIYLHPDAGGRGLGTALYSALFSLLEGEDIHRIYAGITEGNPASNAIHSHFGFRPIGTFTETGRKFGRYWDVTWWER